MTCNQLITEITEVLESHAMIKTVKNLTPQEWLNRDSNPTFPVCCFNINNGSVSKGTEQVRSVQFFFLDKSGAEAEFETDVISDQWQIAEDISQLFRGTRRDYSIDDSITIETISDKFEDYLAGVSYTINFTTTRGFDGCAAPTV